MIHIFVRGITTKAHHNRGLNKLHANKLGQEHVELALSLLLSSIQGWLEKLQIIVKLHNYVAVAVWSFVGSYRAIHYYRGRIAWWMQDCYFCEGEDHHQHSAHRV